MAEIIKKTPPDYSPVFGAVEYLVGGCDAALAVDVEIIDAGRSVTVGAKRLCGASQYCVDVSGYVRALCRVEPCEGGATGFVLCQARTASVAMRVGQVVSGTSFLTAAARAVLPMSLLSGGPLKSTICWSERDELSMIALSPVTCRFRFSAEGITPLVIQGAGYSGSRSMIALIVDMPALAQKIATAGRNAREFDRMEVKAYYGAEAIFSKNYIIREEDSAAVRLAWVNEYGAIDCYSFAGVHESSVEVQREGGADEDMILRSRATGRDEVTTVVSQYEPAAAMAWLGGILSSPQAWCIAGGQARPVDILSRRVVVRGSGPGRMQIAFRESETNLLQYRSC